MTVSTIAGAKCKLAHLNFLNVFVFTSNFLKFNIYK